LSEFNVSHAPIDVDVSGLGLVDDSGLVWGPYSDSWKGSFDSTSPNCGEGVTGDKRLDGNSDTEVSDGGYATWDSSPEWDPDGVTTPGRPGVGGRANCHGSSTSVDSGFSDFQRSQSNEPAGGAGFGDGGCSTWYLEAGGGSTTDCQ